MVKACALGKKIVSLVKQESLKSALIVTDTDTQNSTAKIIELSKDIPKFKQIVEEIICLDSTSIFLAVTNEGTILKMDLTEDFSSQRYAKVFPSYSKNKIAVIPYKDFSGFSPSIKVLVSESSSNSVRILDMDSGSFALQTK